MLVVVGEAREDDDARRRRCGSRMRRIASMPSTPRHDEVHEHDVGRRAARARPPPRSPSAASPTTSMSSCSSRKVRRPCRTTAWSSAISTRIAPRHLAARRVVPRPGAGRRSRSVPPSAARALLHRRQAEAARAQARGRRGRSRRRRRARVETHAGRRSRRGETSTPLAPACLSALFSASWAMRNTSASALRRSRGVAVDLQLDLAPVHAAQHVDVLAQRGREPVASRARRAAARRSASASPPCASRESSCRRSSCVARLRRVAVDAASPPPRP